MGISMSWDTLCIVYQPYSAARCHETCQPF